MDSQGERGGIIGYEGARHILETNDETRQAYFDRFQESHPQYKIQSVHSAQGRNALPHQYEQEATRLRETTDPSSHTPSHREVVLTRGKEAGLNPTRLHAPLHQDESNSMQQKMNTVFSNTDHALHQRQTDLTKKQDALQKAEIDSQQENKTGAVLEKGLKSVIGESSPANPIPFDTTPPTSPLRKR
jgi:hypothetical protein